MGLRQGLRKTRTQTGQNVVTVIKPVPMETTHQLADFPSSPLYVDFVQQLFEMCVLPSRNVNLLFYFLQSLDPFLLNIPTGLIWGRRVVWAESPNVHLLSTDHSIDLENPGDLFLQRCPKPTFMLRSLGVRRSRS